MDDYNDNNYNWTPIQNPDDRFDPNNPHDPDHVYETEWDYEAEQRGTTVNGQPLYGSVFEGRKVNGESVYGGEYGRMEKRQNRKKKTFRVIAVCLVIVAVIGLVNTAIGALVYNFDKNTASTLYVGDREPTKLNISTVNTGEEMSLAEIYATYVNSTVGITVDIVTTNIWGQTVKGAAAGSGFVVTEDGFIVTNYHVIDGANSITVTFVDGKTYPAMLVGGEEDNDVAVIKIDATGLTPVVLGSSDNMLVGEQVTAIGNPLGELTFTQTTGIVSALNRTITMSDGRKMNMIQTDCAINSGNSGGALFNCYGEVIGIVSAKYGGSTSSSTTVEGLGFAIPMDDVAQMIADLIENGYVTGKPYLGVLMDRNGVSSEAQAFGIPAGAVVLGVTPGLPAEAAGLRAGDIVTGMDGDKVTSNNELSDLIAEKAPGDEITLTVYREGQTLTLTATLTEQTMENMAATQALQDEILEQQAQQQQQQQQQQQGNGYGGYSWPFGDQFW